MWLINRYFYTVYVHLGFVSKLHLYTHTHKHKSTTTYCRMSLISGASWRQCIWKPGAKRPLRGGGNPTDPSPSRRSFPRMLKEKNHQQTSPKRALEMCVVGGCHLLAPGTSPPWGTSPRLLGQAFPPFSWQPGSEFCLPCARAFCISMDISEWHYFI